MRSYLDLLQRILDTAVNKDDRTKTGTISLRGSPSIEHDMAGGFPLLTTKKMPFKSIKVELEGFLNGITNKGWYQERGCTIWDEWCSPKKVPYGTDDETKMKMKEERDLGPFYGFQWRHFGAKYGGCDKDYSGQGVDQLKKRINWLKKDLNNRRALVVATNPEWEDEMALFPCHDSFQMKVADNKLDLTWRQRSVDTFLGLPFNIASYGLLLHLVAKELGVGEGILTGQLGDTHLYLNHLEQAREQLKRQPYNLPKIETPNFTSLFDWKPDQTKIAEGTYQSHPKISAKPAV